MVFNAEFGMCEQRVILSLRKRVYTESFVV